ncbi:hypothetical protein NLJ89_g11298 [Agrocybe chaxingu]|uniref:Uncharacterized protein n=1 Tax=Agrocybe chaxingu TaxID=84603 RepID=A0A9W8JNZ9_9AGAR|nr:hypothetical protein NLJ89_g11298 [Agrocybe chaxingu]
MPQSRRKSPSNLASPSSSSIPSSSIPPCSAPPSFIPFAALSGATIVEHTMASPGHTKHAEEATAKIAQQEPAREVKRDTVGVGRDREQRCRPRSHGPKKDDAKEAQENEHTSTKEALDDKGLYWYERRERERQHFERLAEMASTTAGWTRAIVIADSRMSKVEEVQQGQERERRFGSCSGSVKEAGAKEEREQERPKHTKEDQTKKVLGWERRPRSTLAEEAEQHLRTEEFSVGEVKAACEREHRPRSQRTLHLITTPTATTTTDASTTMTRASPKLPVVKQADQSPMPKFEDDLFSERGTQGIPVQPFKLKTPPHVRWPRCGRV